MKEVEDHITEMSKDKDDKVRMISMEKEIKFKGKNKKRQNRPISDI